MNKRLSHADSLIVQYLLEDPTIRGILVDAKQKEMYSLCTVNEDGSITFGKTSFKWWNSLVNDEKTISFNEFAMKVASAISGQKNNTNKKLLGGLLDVIASKGIKDEDYSYVLDQLLLAVKFGMKDSPLACRVMNIESGDPKEGNAHDNSDGKKINVHIDPTPFAHSFRINPFGETINIRGEVTYKQVDQQYVRPTLKRKSPNTCYYFCIIQFIITL